MNDQVVHEVAAVLDRVASADASPETKKLARSCMEGVRIVVAELGLLEPAVMNLGQPDSAGEETIVVSVPIKQLQLRLTFSKRILDRSKRVTFTEHLRSRIDEAQKAHDRFVRRTADVRSKVEASLARNGGMRLISMEMRPEPVDQSIDWYEVRLVSSIETLDHFLRPVVQQVQGWTARQMAGIFRRMGVEHKRLKREAARASKANALFSISRSAETLATESGLTLIDIATRLLAGERGFDLSGEGATPCASRYLCVFNGRVHLSSEVVHRFLPARYVTFDELSR